MRTARLAAGCTIFAGAAFAAGTSPTLTDLARLGGSERENALAALRDSAAGDAALKELSTQLTSQADARRDSGRPPVAR